MKKTSIAIVSVVSFFIAFCALPAWAAEVAPEQAELAAKNWVLLHPEKLTADFASAEPVRVQSARNADDRVLYHVVEMDGDGFVVVSGDTELPPVVAFSGSGTLDLSDLGNPLVALLENDLPGRIAALPPTPAPAKKADAKKAAVQEETHHPYAAEWAELLSKPAPAKKAVVANKSGRTSLSDVRVAPLVKSKWGQTTWNGLDTFNYYTPKNYCSGCVATALAQIMRYWKQPTKSVSSGTYWCWVDGKRVKAVMFGGTYSWNDMPLTEASCTTLKQRQAIGKLLFDVGAVCQMQWEASGSGTYGSMGAQALRGRFGYASALSYDPDGDSDWLGSDIAGSRAYRNAILGSLDAGMPVSLGLTTKSRSGHQVVVDGYGYQNGRVYCHLNCGWSGSEDIWYNLMGEPVTTDRYQFVNAVVYNIHPTRGGDVVSGRVLDEAGNPVAGAAVTLALPSGGTKTAKTNAKGIYSFRVAKSGKHTLSAISGSLKSAKRTVSVQLGQAATLTLDAKANVTSSFSGRLGNSWGNDLVVKLLPTMTIAFNANGGKCSLKRRTVKTGSRIGKLPTAKRSGWKFLGWYTKKSGGGKVSAKTVIKANGTFYAHWAKNHCKVTFKANGGKGKMAAQKLPYNKTVKLSKNKFTRKGYVFIGWALSKNGEVAYGNAAKMKNMRASGKPLTLYAKWARKYCRVTFKANGGKGKMGVQKLPYHKVVRLAKNKYTRKGYRFAGWALSPTGKVEFKNAEKVRNERASGIPLVLYARWKKVPNTALPPEDVAAAPAGAASRAVEAPAAEKEAVWAAVTTSDRSDGAAVADGDEETSWTPGTADGSWLVLSFPDVQEVEDVEVLGENLPEGTRILFSQDADDWTEDLPCAARYVWVAFPAATGGEPPVVREIRVTP